MTDISYKEQIECLQYLSDHKTRLRLRNKNWRPSFMSLDGVTVDLFPNTYISINGVFANHAEKDKDYVSIKLISMIDFSFDVRIPPHMMWWLLEDLEAVH